MDSVDVAGTGDDVTMNVAVGVEKSGVAVKVLVCVAVLVFVIVMAGVLVGTFGTQRTWPTWMIVDAPMQFADCN